jgi:hypothetical protein
MILQRFTDHQNFHARISIGSVIWQKLATMIGNEEFDTARSLISMTFKLLLRIAIVASVQENMAPGSIVSYHYLELSTYVLIRPSLRSEEQNLANQVDARDSWRKQCHANV